MPSMFLFMLFLQQYFTTILKSNFIFQVSSHLYLVSLSPVLPSLSNDSHLEITKSAQMVFLLLPQVPSLYFQNSKQSILVRGKSDHASPLFKTLQWHPISFGAKANLVTSTKFASLFFSCITPIFTPSVPTTLILTHQLPQGLCCGCFLCPESFSPKCQHSLLFQFHQVFIYSNAIFSVSPSLAIYLKLTPYLLFAVPTSFFSITLITT